MKFNNAFINKLYAVSVSNHDEKECIILNLVFPYYEHTLEEWKLNLTLPIKLKII